MGQWYKAGGLDEDVAGEGEIDFAYRVLEYMAKSLTIGRKNKGHSVREVMLSMTCTCHGCNSVFVTCMRRKGIPARVRHGQKLKKENVGLPPTHFACGWSGSRPTDKQNGHSKSEFYAQGLGWIPVETVIRRPDQAQKRLAGSNEEEPHLVKFYDMGVSTFVDLRQICSAVGSKMRFEYPRTKLRVGQLSGVRTIPVKRFTMRPNAEQRQRLKVHMTYAIEA